MASTSSSTEFTTLVTLHHHDFRVERLHMWWDFFSTVEQVGIKKDLGRATSLLTMLVNWDLLQAFTSFWDLMLRCMSIRGVDLVLTIEEYTALLQFPSYPTGSMCLSSSIGLTDSWPTFLDYIGDFINGEQGWEKLRIRAFLIAFSSIIIFPSFASKIDLGVVPLVDSPEPRRWCAYVLCPAIPAMVLYPSTLLFLNFFLDLQDSLRLHST
uniref:Aminotransferase-like plant mobile domain-containing protein n=1 Tax=Fagus sylvatica TaxID=28930 RepID=A0A2N9EZL1_FAGSY